MGARPVQRGIRTWLSKVFAVNPAGLNWPLGVLYLDVILVPVFVGWAIGYEQYIHSAVFGAIFTLLIDRRGAITQRLARLGIFAVAGAGVAALGYSLGGAAWGWLALVSFGVTLVAGLAAAVGADPSAGALFLNLWFIIALASAIGLHQHTGATSHVWAQVVAWVAGSGLWILVTVVAWLVRGRPGMPQPADTSRGRPGPQLIVFALIRAIAIAGSVALAYGLNLSHGDWLPIATLFAMKPDLQQTTVAAAQRLVGTVTGAVAAGLLLLVPAAEHGPRLDTVDHALQVVAIVFLMHATAVALWNNAVSSAAIAAAILILVDLQQPTNYSAEGDRALWTLVGVAIGTFVTLLTQLLPKHTGERPAET
jgi:uncharacterized membrane protein YccC